MQKIKSQLNKAIQILLMFLMCAVAAIQTGFAQEKNNAYKRDVNEPIIWLDSVASDRREGPRKKKMPKRLFYGIKTKKGFTKVDRNGKVTYELFYTLKKHQDPNPYISDIYWYHKQKRKIIIGPIGKKDITFARILHGPYTKLLEGDVIEQGIFYIGAKHGRWETYAKGEEELLTDKRKYYKGWPKESKIEYYDAERKKPKQIEPIVSGEPHGDFYRFHLSGLPAEHGKYEYGQKIGVWTEFFDSRKKVKKTTQYAATAFEKDFKPFVIIEYDQKGTVIYDKIAEDKKPKP